MQQEHISAPSNSFSCPQCPKVFATRSNLKRHMENPNIHNIPYIRSRDQKRWRGHAKKVISKEETTERMRKWRAENKDKNKRNDLRCRVYRLARQKYGDQDSEEKQTFIREEIARRLGRRMLLEHKDEEKALMPMRLHGNHKLVELPFYSAPQQKIQLPSLTVNSTRGRITPTGSGGWPSPMSISTSSRSPTLSPPTPCLSPNMARRTSSCSLSSAGSRSTEQLGCLHPIYDASSPHFSADSTCTASPSSATTTCLPSLQTLLSSPLPATSGPLPSPCLSETNNVKYVDQMRILDEFVGLVLDYADNTH